jgi:Ca2+-binding RTX toxin-like protein
MSLTAAEQYFLELMNRARLDPLAEAARYGIDLNQGLVAGTLAGGSRPVLAANDFLDLAANDHSAWMISTDTFDHYGIAGSTPGDRMDTAGYDFTGSWTWGENISWRGSSGAMNMNTAVDGHHEGLFRSAGHRTNTLSAGFREVGIGQVGGDFQGWNASMLSVNFARTGSNVFVTGVAYNDTNLNRFYSIGEGRANVTFQIVGGAQDSSEAAGGYSVGVLGNTQTAVRILHGSFVSNVTVDTSTGNAKLDLVGDREVFSSASITLGTGAVTDVQLLGTLGLSATGNASGNRLAGNAAANQLSGLDGADVIYAAGGNDLAYGGTGNDTLHGEAGGDHLWGGAGADALYGGTDAGVDYARYDDANHGNLTISLLTGLAGTGAAAGDTYSGIEGLVGGVGHDVVIGDAAANWLFGSGGSDFIDGLGGSDYLNGGAGADRFRLSTAIGAGNVDRIADFQTGVDDILLARAIFAAIGASLTADEFVIGAAADGNDHLLYNSTSGALTYDTNGNIAGGATQIATLGTGLALTVADFVMV